MPLGLAAPPGLVPLVWPGPNAEALVITHIFGLATGTALRFPFRSHGEPDGALLILCADITIGLGNPKGVIQEAL